MARKNIVEVDAEVWAESGGTGGMYGKLWKQGRIRIVSGLTPLPEITPAQRRAAKRDKGIDLGGNDNDIVID